ncbi:hypothetical protein IJH06_02070 [Candidatus Saccharibacteria bacterium]|nr:hypothetical protein [Candidatus Saccharibacteria bacterium]
MQAIHTKYKNRSNNTPTGIFSKISRLRSMFLFFSVILASMIFRVRSMIFGRTFVAFPRYAFVILAFLATMSVFGFSASVFADSSSSAVYGDEGSVENSTNFSVTVEELNALELRLSASDLVLDLNPTSDVPVFGSSDLSVTVYTTNTTGYYLTMTPTTTNLTRTEALNGNYPTIATLASAVAPSTFSSTSDTTTANKWGYKVNTTNLSTIDTTNYNPAVTTAVPLNKTTAPLANGDETDITFAAKVDADTVAGSYKTTLSFTAVTNANTYSITFNSGSASSDSSLANMPSPNPQTGALESGSSTSITLSSSTPTRAGYSFLGWCSVAPTTSNSTDSCSGTTYQPGGSITIYTDTPDITLYAMWGINSYAITITNSNTSSSVSSLTIPYGGSATVTVTPDSNYYLSDVSCPSGYTCSGYNTGTSYTSVQTVTITNNGATAGGTLAFTGAISLSAIQNLPSSECTTTATDVIDNRDNQVYTIQRLADGRCWMMTNLNLGATDLTTDLTSSNTNLSDTITASTFNGWKKTSGTGTYTSGEFISVSGTDSTSGTAYGTLYNYCAASAGTICTSSNSNNASSDLCPAGWRLPTSNFEGEFATLYGNVSYNTYDKMRASVANGGAAFALAGYFYKSTPTGQGSYGAYWSSTRFNSTHMHRLYLSTSDVDPSNNAYRYYGYSIRCILKDTLQDFSSSDFSSMTVGTTTTLRDARTGTAYDVKMISLNGTKTLWMMSNLKLPGGTTLTTSDSNVTADYTLPSDTGSSGWVDDYCKPYMATAGGEYYYNWPAATARTNSTSNTSSGCSNDTSNSKGDICPKGWRLPVYSGEVDNTTWRSNLQANGSLTTTGYFYSGSQYQVGSYGRWWTSPRGSEYFARLLYSDGSTAYAGSSGGKSNGFSVRCMRTS